MLRQGPVTLPTLRAFVPVILTSYRTDILTCWYPFVADDGSRARDVALISHSVPKVVVVRVVSFVKPVFFVSCKKSFDAAQSRR